MKFVSYDQDGRINGLIEIPEAHPERAFIAPTGPDTTQADETLTLKECRNHLVRQGKVVARAPFPGAVASVSVIANGQDKSTIPALPAGTRISGERVFPRALAAQEDLDLTATEPGDYTIDIDPFPYLPFSVVIHGT